jgi:hypothetical protein
MEEELKLHEQEMKQKAAAQAKVSSLPLLHV